MNPSVTRKRTILASLLALLMLAAFVALPASAAPAKKLYTANIVGTPAPSNAGASSHFQLTLTNSQTSSQSFGSADLIIPVLPSTTTPAFTNVVNIVATAPPGKTWSGTVNATGTRINLRSPAADGTSVNSIPAGKSVVVDFDATAPCAAGSYTFKTDVRQSNVFQGPQNDFNMVAIGSNLTTTVGGVCFGAPASITLTSGPSNATAGGTTSATVKVTDGPNGSGNGLTGVSVHLESTGLASSPSTSQMTGAGGTATFTNVPVRQTAGTAIPMSAIVDGSSPLISASSTFNITAGAPIVTFTTQPEDSLKDTAIGGPPTVTAADSHGNPVSGLSITLSVSPVPVSFASGVLTGDTTVVTNSNGVAAFPNVKIALSSSGYKLRSSVGDVDSAAFNITSTDSSCTNDCSAILPNGGTVSGPAGTTFIVEHNDVVDCGTSFVGFAGTVTIIPGGSGTITIKFVDPYNASGEPHPQQNVTYPFCKGGVHTTVLDYGDPADRCDVKATPCVENQFFEVGSLNLHTLIQMDQNDPPIKH